MSFKVTTKLTSNANGRSQVVAKGNGKQLTHNVDGSKSNDWNHGTAAGALLLKLGYTDNGNDVTHESSEDKVRHTFTV